MSSNTNEIVVESLRTVLVRKLVILQRIYSQDEIMFDAVNDSLAVLQSLISAYRRISTQNELLTQIRDCTVMLDNIM